MLVVDLHALQPIDLLDLIGEVGGQRLHTHDRQDVVRHGVAVHQQVATLDVVAFLNRDVLALGDQVFLGLLALVIRDDDDPWDGGLRTARRRAADHR